MWAIFRTVCRKLECKSEWGWRRCSQASMTVWGLKKRGEGNRSSQSCGVCLRELGRKERPGPPLCRVNSLQLFLRKQGKGGSRHRPCAPAFRRSANWVLWWMTFKNKLSLVPKTPLKGFLTAWFNRECVCVRVSVKVIQQLCRCRSQGGF